MQPPIIAVVDDLFFASKIRGTGEQAGARVLFVKSAEETIQKALEASPRLIIVDMNTRCCDPMNLARALKEDERLSRIPLLGFFSHVETELQRAAIGAGFDRVIPRSVFTKKLPEILAGTLFAQNTA